MSDNKYVFISHSNKGADEGCPDAELTNRLYAYLTAHNVYCWYDKSLDPGIWADQIYQKMVDASAYVLVASKQSLTSPQVQREISIMAESGKLLLPFVIDDYYFIQDKAKGSAGYYLGNNMHQAVFLDKFANEEAAFSRLLSMIPQDISRLECDLSEFNLSPDDETIIKYLGNNGCVSIPPFITGISKDAFLNNSALNKLIIPPSVTTVGRRAFFGCKNLTTVEGMAGVTDIDESAFGRTGLFAGCDNLRVYGGIAFGGNAHNGVLEIPTGVKIIAAGAFRDNDAAELRLPDGLEVIGDLAFSDGILLENLRLPASLKHIGKRAFCGCPIKQIRFDGSRLDCPEAFDNYDTITVTEEK